MTLPERIRYYRQARGLTQTGLASLCGLSRVKITQIENGHRQVHADELVQLARALHLTPAGLLDGDGEDPYQRGYEDGWRAAREEYRAALQTLREALDAAER